MKKYGKIGRLALAATVVLAGCMTRQGEAPLRLGQGRIARLGDAVFEVVIPKRQDELVTYADGQRLPVEELPFSERNDHYYSVGTAFAVAPDRLVSAAHVFQLDLQAIDREYFIRDRSGQVHAVAQVLRYSQYRDLVEFTLATLPEGLEPLTVSPTAQVGETVYTVGNANGEGIAVRDGQISSFTFEPVAGAWKDLRFSAPASPGNSGGPLLDTRGAVVGVVVRKNDSENLNVAVPIGELEHTAAAAAEFFVSSSEANVDGEPTVDWRFQTPLPSSLDALGKVAEANRRQFHLRQWRALQARTRATTFPQDPALGDYLWNQTYSPHIQTLSFDAKDGYGLSPSDPVSEHVSTHGERVAVMVAEPTYDLAEVGLPEGADAADYVAKPQLLLAAIFEACNLFRDFNGRHIPLKSYGPPTVQGTFTDGLGRPWLKAVWRTWYNEGSLLLNCLPGPTGFGCSLDNVATTEETFGLQEKFEEYDANLRQMSYRGAVGAWRRFLALGDAWVPAALRGLEIGAKAGRVAFTGGEFHLTYPQPLFGDRSSLFVGVGYGLKELVRSEIHSVEFDHGPGLVTAEQFDLYLEPPATADKASQRSFAGLERPGTEDGSVYRVLGHAALQNGRRIVKTVACRGPGRKPPKSVVATCDAIKGG